ncbi:MAG: hypothetical protein JGK03_23765 [Microcoleus sp. PH2017_25_DOB_D_A]|uniref:hypothetical protein n=1 Tax=unclassified Microcoleus TaxID=2642155 RepID=UPI001E107BA9|nr:MULTISPECIES: hypothetical protein [unclassified Microcoleus]TAE07353.1 MAG: hypothetical protein EAZ94_28850 [Oscillatoriales cyanobacterium]MCC3537131.1 hypothetical protein [Microcoleus sp. PH2017_25_DOB_D_A]MCC3549444.1 hypothetical protein [Microcoleus sp. PH2017_24_DOB_U_A]TAE18102.1 MAG: hypothetical protein EAZ93_30155 [Oscillatoriales cyanobacterium]TAE36106.1 MAG: hypothetical protein EAZ90_29170 [Oscillatoriales cyanobacterium]
MNNSINFTIHLEKPNGEKYADPPEDSLGELSHFELGLKLFCFECDRLVSIEIGEEKVKVFLDSDICMLLEDELPKKLSELSQGKPINIEFVESVCITLELQPLANDRISCNLKQFGYLSPNQFTLKSRNQQLELNKNQVITELKGFVEQLMEMALNGGYITPEEKQEFLMPLREIAPASAIC